MIEGLIYSLLAFQFAWSLDYVFPGVWKKIIEWHKEILGPMEVQE